LRFVRHLLLVIVLLLIAPAAASAACGSTIIDDYLDDGSVDGSYSQACFKDALGRLDDDLREYTNAEADITAAMRQQRPKPQKPATTQEEQAPSEQERTQSDEVVAPVENDDNNDGGGGGGEEPSAQPQEAEGQSPDEPASTADQIDTGAVKGVETEVALAEDVTADDGPLQQALRSADSSSGNDVPVPVLVLGGLAILLIAVGAGGIVLRRLHDS
jgi:hypothetical protein